MAVEAGLLRPRADPQVLGSIPHEILRQIASYIDQPSAQALATTCKSLRDAGEMRIWERISLQHDTYFNTGSHVKLARAQKQPTIEKRILQGFKSDPRRVGYCNELVVTPFNLNEMQQVEIVEQVCSNLISLTVNIEVNIHPHDIRLSTAANDITPDKEVPRCEFLFHLIDIGLQFKRLRDFRFTTAELASFQYIGYLLQEMPAIDSVEIMPWTSYRRKPEVDEDTIADINSRPPKIGPSLHREH